MTVSELHEGEEGHGLPARDTRVYDENEGYCSDAIMSPVGGGQSVYPRRINEWERRLLDKCEKYFQHRGLVSRWQTLSQD